MRFEWRFTRRFWLMVLVAVVLASNVTFSTTQTATATHIKTRYLDVMQAKNFLWTGLPYVAQLKAYVVYDNGLINWNGGDWYYVRRPKVWKAGSFVDCHMGGLVSQHLTGQGCGVTRLSRRKVEVYMVWMQEVKVFGIGFERSCWMRAYITVPDAGISNRRWGGDC